MAPPLAHIEDVTITRRGQQILQSLSLSIRAGDFWGIVGPNGAGKTTLLRLLAGVLPPCQGRARLLGRDITRGGHVTPVLSPARRDVGVLLQRHNFSTHVPFTIRDVVAFGRIPHRRWGRLSAADHEAVDHAIGTLDLTGMQQRLYNALSGGEQQKVQLARLLAQSPRLILLDEPTAGLDLDWQERLTALVGALHTEHACTVVMVTHDIDRLPACCTNVLLLKGGRQIAQGPPETVFADDVLSRLYGCRVEVIRGNGRFSAVSCGQPAAASGPARGEGTAG